MDILEEVREVRGAYDVRDVAEHLGVSRQTVTNYILRGELRAWRLGGKFKVTEADLRAYLERCRPEAVNLEQSETQTPASL